MNEAKLDKEKLELLSSYSSCDVCRVSFFFTLRSLLCIGTIFMYLKYSQVADALLKLNHPHGGYLPDIIMFSPEQQAGPAKLVGPVFTVKVKLVS